MIERYYTFDVDRFLRDHDFNVRKLRELELEREAAADSGGMDYKHVRGSGISDPTVQKALQRERIELKIKEYQEYLNAFDRLTADLAGDELLLLQFLMKPKRNRSIETLRNALGYEQSTIYDMLSEFRKKLSERADFGG